MSRSTNVRFSKKDEVEAQQALTCCRQYFSTRPWNEIYRSTYHVKQPVLTLGADTLERFCLGSLVDGFMLYEKTQWRCVRLGTGRGVLSPACNNARRRGCVGGEPSAGYVESNIGTSCTQLVGLAED